ncbi:ankyrin repeat protein [Lactarius deliciosus]|nr:ankyrin repeat protein [Lactarius deliciosus]
MGNSPLHLAAAYGHLEVARLLIGRNADVNAQNNNGFTPFLHASRMERHDVMRFLLDHGADAEVSDPSGNTPSEVASGPRQEEIVHLFSWRVVVC